MRDLDDNIMPEFEALYDPRLKDNRTGVKNYAVKDKTDKKFNIQISRTYPILRKFSHADVRKDTYLIDQNGLKSVVKFYRSDMVPNEEVLKKLKELSERLHACIIHIYEYGFDENTKRWYVIQEYAQYGSLRDLNELKINLKVLNLLLKEIIEGLKILHENNILHLNLKPSNILMRENQPFQAAFTDFDIFSMIKSGHMKNIAPLEVRPMYSSPELLTGVVGPEADYWSLGMTILELLVGGHPFSNLDDKSIVDILLENSISIPEHIPEDYKILLRGLLTKDPQGRWGYAEVKRWLEKDTNIPVYFSDAPKDHKIKISNDYTVPYRFLNEEYLSIEAMIPAFLKSEEAWEAAKDHLSQGNISKWLLKNSDKNTCSQVDNIREQSAGDSALGIISLIYTFKNDLPFILYGTLINHKNLYICAVKSLKNEASKGEKAIINLLLNGKLIEYYREYMILTSKADDELLSLFEAIGKAVSRKENYHKKLNTLCKMMDILATPLAYVLPDKISDNVIGNLDFVASTVDVVITGEQYNEIIGDLIVPEEMKEEINNALSSGSPSDYLNGLEKLKESSLLTKGELNQLQDEYILPVWLEDGLLGKETIRYVAAIKLLNNLKREELFIRKNDCLDYLGKYVQFIGYVIGQNGVDQHRQKGETLGQKWIRLLKYDVGYEDYIKLARYIKSNVVLSMIPHVEEILKRVSTQTISIYSLNEIIKYLHGLKSGEIKWDNADNQIVNKIRSLSAKKTKKPIQFLEKIKEGVSEKFLQTLTKNMFGINADERTMEKESALAGALGGAFIGFIAWIIIVSLELETSFYGPTVLGLLLGLLRKSIHIALLCICAGFAGAFFLGLGTLIEVIYAFPIAIIGTAKIGAFFGRRINKFSFYDDIFSKYNGRINDVVNAAEAASE